MVLALTLREVTNAHAQRDGQAQSVIRISMNAEVTPSCAIMEHVRIAMEVIVVTVVKDILDIIVSLR